MWPYKGMNQTGKSPVGRHQLDPCDRLEGVQNQWAMSTQMSTLVYLLRPPLELIWKHITVTITLNLVCPVNRNGQDSLFRSHNCNASAAILMCWRTRWLPMRERFCWCNIMTSVVPIWAIGMTRYMFVFLSNKNFWWNRSHGIEVPKWHRNTARKLLLLHQKQVFSMLAKWN